MVQKLDAVDTGIDITPTLYRMRNLHFDGTYYWIVDYIDGYLKVFRYDSDWSNETVILSDNTWAIDPVSDVDGWFNPLYSDVHHYLLGNIGTDEYLFGNNAGTSWDQLFGITDAISIQYDGDSGIDFFYQSSSNKMGIKIAATTWLETQTGKATKGIYHNEVFKYLLYTGAAYLLR